MTMLMLLVSASLLSIAMGNGSDAACQCVQETSLANALRNDAVVVATVTDKDVNTDRILYELDVTETFNDILNKGHIQVSSQSGPCSQDSLSIGHNYLLALENIDNQPITLSRCSLNRPWAAISQDLRMVASQSNAATKRLHRRLGIELDVLKKETTADDKASVRLDEDKLGKSTAERDADSAYGMVDYGDDHDTDGSTTKCQNGESVVEDGWTGQGRALGNECNVCMCTKGHLSCTKMLCFGRSS